MSDTLIYGICDSCEKKYRVPSADKTYPCKSCGGTVAVHELEETRSASERFNARRQKDRGSTPIWVGMAVVLVLAAGGLVGYQMGAFGTVLGASADGRLFETDMQEVDAAFAEHWNASDKQELTLMHHPTGRDEFALRLEEIPQNRDWGATLRSLASHEGKLLDGTAGAPEKGVITATCGDYHIAASWQFDENIGRWFIYNFWITPTHLEPRVKEFRTAWALSDTTALLPFFGETSAQKLQDLFDKQIAKAGWKAAHPKLGAVNLIGEEGALTPASKFLGGKVESVFEREGGGVLIHWRFDQGTDQWKVSGLKF